MGGMYQSILAKFGDQPIPRMASKTTKKLKVGKFDPYKELKEKEPIKKRAATETSSSSSDGDKSKISGEERQKKKKKPVVVEKPRTILPDSISKISQQLYGYN